MNRYILFILLITVTSVAWGQSTRVRGKITDAKTGEPLPLVNVVFKGTTVGVTSDFDGIYTLETREKVTELQASFVGYESQTVKVVPGSYNALDFQLVPYTVDLEEVNV